MLPLGWPINGQHLEGLYRCIKTEEGNANRKIPLSKKHVQKIEVGQGIFRIREIEVEQRVNLGS